MLRDGPEQLLVICPLFIPVSTKYIWLCGSQESVTMTENIMGLIPYGSSVWWMESGEPGLDHLFLLEFLRQGFRSIKLLNRFFCIASKVSC